MVFVEKREIKKGKWKEAGKSKRRQKESTANIKYTHAKERKDTNEKTGKIEQQAVPEPEITMWISK